MFLLSGVTSVCDSLLQREREVQNLSSLKQGTGIDTFCSISKILVKELITDGSLKWNRVSLPCLGTGRKLRDKRNL
jgi:hypothetical protein